MGWTKSARGNLSLPIITIIICTIGFISLFYIDKISTYHSVLRFKPCSKCTFTKSNKSHTDVKRLENNTLNEYDRYECNHTDGNWVFNTSIKPLYTDRTCSYIDREYACVKNGRNDSDYLYWEWQPDDCVLPRSNIGVQFKD
uniref:Protein trichome birefringence-like 3 n=1 Tax=Nicotiana tabacum TaxID=4097 RepID=A0A1S4BZ20_TOBAC|nr:PREDICTED: protein trichome birefringence-like 3 [Nicotiana tabacum]